ncbi:MAG: 2Fe-2S iron-sulfur cluster-binding protein [Polyangiaceae bacterium]
MPIVRYLKEGKEVEVPIGASILQASQEGGLPEGYACGGVCGCSTCHVYVKKGAELLSEMEDDENDILDKAFDVQSSSRLGCQARIQKDGVVEVEITRESYEAYYNEHPEERKKLEAGANGAAPSAEH